jgi:protein TonB
MLDERKNHGRLLAALLLAGLLHALLILGISFEMPAITAIDKSLDVVLVVTPSPKPPVTAEYLAPESQQGGGEASKKAEPKATPKPLPKIKPRETEPMPPPRRSVAEKPAHQFKPESAANPKPALREKPVGEEPAPAKEKPAVEENPVIRDDPVLAKTPAPQGRPMPAAEAGPVLKQAKSDKKIAAGASQQGAPEREPRHLSAELLSQQIAEVTTEFNKSRETQAKQQRMVYINSVNAHKHNAAAYEHAWLEKVERIGNLNFPEEARRQNLTGSLLLAVGVNADGSIYSIKVRQSSGEAVLDEAAERIVRMAAPFAPFPPGLREEADIVVITRTWRFSVGNRVDTGG